VQLQAGGQVRRAVVPELRAATTADTRMHNCIAAPPARPIDDIDPHTPPLRTLGARADPAPHPLYTHTNQEEPGRRSPVVIPKASRSASIMAYHASVSRERGKSCSAQPLAYLCKGGGGGSTAVSEERESGRETARTRSTYSTRTTIKGGAKRGEREGEREVWHGLTVSSTQ
jgi:hypothetical protein